MDPNIIKNERRDGVADTTEINTKVLRYYKQLHANKLENLEDE